ncbi:hypothetical protein GCM10011391_39280 [Pullulanibacillus camelliae]|uniref:Uncharacterized protein n=1 Tax=Pullulanibacillus camelliae TaxID=1707096 RepID=A0A8J3E135_9BACL|nr:hypothetical protein GCM10011391_39280 [Pullulanibacillus camelliae]
MRMNQHTDERKMTKGDFFMNIVGVAIVSGIIALAIEVNPF